MQVTDALEKVVKGRNVSVEVKNDVRRAMEGRSVSMV